MIYDNEYYLVGIVFSSYIHFDIFVLMIMILRISIYLSAFIKVIHIFEYWKIIQVFEY